MSLSKKALISSLFVSIAYTAGAYGQTPGPAPSSPGAPCHATPGEGQDNNSLTETLDDCNGVLKPPAAGDPDIVEEAPDVGKTPVIPPSALPEQQDQVPPESDRTDAAAEQEDYSVGQIVDAIADPGPVIERLNRKDAASIEVHDVSILFDGIDAAVINASLAAHQEGVEQLRSAIEGNGPAMEDLKSRGLAPAGVVAAEVDDFGTVVDLRPLGQTDTPLPLDAV